MAKSKHVCSGCNHPDHEGPGNGDIGDVGHPDYDPDRPDVELWWWLSFVDDEKPRGNQFLGCAIVDGKDFGAAIARAWATGCNPGGEALALPFLPTAAVHLEAGDKHRLLTAEESRALDDRIGAAAATVGAPDTRH